MEPIAALYSKPIALLTREELAAVSDNVRQYELERPREKQPPASGLAIRCIADIDPVPVQWLWLNVVPLGKLTLLAGNPELGKSQISLYMAAHVSRGATWFDGSPCVGGRVLLLSAEDDPADTIRPRLDAAGALTHRIDIIEGVHIEKGRHRPFNLSKDIERLELALKNSALDPVKLIIIDPISAYLGDIDSHVNSSVRGVLSPLAELAARYRVAIVGITHLNKASKMRAIHRIQGSIAFSAAARSVWMVEKDPNDESRRFMFPVKLNLAPKQQGFAYTIKASDKDAAYVVWETDRVQIDVSELLRWEEAGSQNKSARQEGIDLLLEKLADGPVPVKDIFHQADSIGLSSKTIRIAARQLDVVKKQKGFHGGWTWELPTQIPQKHTDALSNNGASVEGDGHLCSNLSTQPADGHSQKEGM